MISKEEYILNKIKFAISFYDQNNSNICPSVLRDMIEQWSYDYEMGKDMTKLN